MMGDGQAHSDILAKLSHIFEHSPWIAEEAFDRGYLTSQRDAETIHAALWRVVREAPRERQLALINIHPDLAGKLAMSGELTAESTSEQSSAGLDRLTAAEFARFNQLNDAYKQRFGFVFIMAVKGSSKEDILASFERRLQNDAGTEFETALQQIARITRMRLDLLFPAAHGAAS